jgi:3-methylfumaryl-CoA hydratase
MSDDTVNLEHLRGWIGRAETREDLISPWTASAMAATVRNDSSDWPPGRALPPLWHWCYFLPAAPQNQLGPDGHPARGGFMPPVPLPRRMWAASQLEFFSPLRLAVPARRVSRVEDVTLKHGKSGTLVFVRVAHTYHAAGADGTDSALIRERQDIVYREAAQPSAVAPSPVAPSVAPPAQAQWGETLHPDPALLLRYSALTFNAHRIHYDYPYVTQVEGYAGLVVHGPLIATLLLEAAQRQHPGRAVARYQFKAVRPLICGGALRVCGAAPAADGDIALWAEDGKGVLLMQAALRLA